MGTKNNVNPNYYKTAGRERPGDDVVQEIHKQTYTQEKASEEEQNFIPGAAPVGEGESSGGKAHEDTRRDIGQTIESANSSSNT